jgi:hypothetical protein
METYEGSPQPWVETQGYVPMPRERGVPCGDKMCVRVGTRSGMTPSASAARDFHPGLPWVARGLLHKWAKLALMGPGGGSWGGELPATDDFDGALVSVLAGVD